MKSDEGTKLDAHPIGSIVLVITGLAIAMGSLRYEFGSLETPGAGFFPFFTGLSMAFFSAIPLLQSLGRGWMPLRSLWEGTKWQRMLVVTAAQFLYCFFLQDLGFVLVAFLSMAFLYRLAEKPKWGATVLFASVTTASFYVLFQVWLEAQLPRGFLGF